MDDYISREEVVKEIKSRIFAADDAWESGYNTAMAGIMEWIEHMPSADVQPVKHGRWIFQNRYDEDGRCIFHCSECNFETKVFPCNLIPWQMHEIYCTGCGARMTEDLE